jgi:hypothetical protein
MRRLIVVCIIALAGLSSTPARASFMAWEGTLSLALVGSPELSVEVNGVGVAVDTGNGVTLGTLRPAGDRSSGRLQAFWCAPTVGRPFSTRSCVPDYGILPNADRQLELEAGQGGGESEEPKVPAGVHSDAGGHGAGSRPYASEYESQAKRSDDLERREMGYREENTRQRHGSRRSEPPLKRDHQPLPVEHLFEHGCEDSSDGKGHQIQLPAVCGLRHERSRSQPEHRACQESRHPGQYSALGNAQRE